MNEARPLGETGPITNTHSLQSTTGRVLERLDRVKKSGKGWASRCPSHEDRHASLSISEGRDGRALLWCHAGCSIDAITAALGLEVRDLFQPREVGGHDKTSRRREKPRPIPQKTAAALADRPDLGIEVAIATVLARLPDPVMRQDVVRCWDYLSTIVDIPFVVRLARDLRGTAFLRFAWCNTSHRTGAFSRAVDHFLERAAS